jgi:hypothetical protein
MPYTSGAPSVRSSRQQGSTLTTGRPAKCGTASSRCFLTLACRLSRSLAWLDTAGPQLPRRSTESRSGRSSCTAPRSWTESSQPGVTRMLCYCQVPVPGRHRSSGFLTDGPAPSWLVRVRTCLALHFPGGNHRLCLDRPGLLLQEPGRRLFAILPGPAAKETHSSTKEIHSRIIGCRLADFSHPRGQISRHVQVFRAHRGGRTSGPAASTAMTGRPTAVAAAADTQGSWISPMPGPSMGMLSYSAPAASRSAVGCMPCDPGRGGRI